VPRNRTGPKAPAVGNNGIATKGNISAPGQPNGQPATVPQSMVPSDAGLPYGAVSALRGAAADTAAPPPPPGVTPDAHAAFLAASQAPPPGLTPLSAPPDNDAEPVTAGAHGPMGVGPPHPMAAPVQLAPSTQGILAAAAAATQSPALQALADRAAATNS
jgi:hypothetical protein